MIATALLLRCLSGEPVCPQAADAVWADPELAPFAREVVLRARRLDLLPKEKRG